VEPHQHHHRSLTSLKARFSFSSLLLYLLSVFSFTTEDEDIDGGDELSRPSRHRQQQRRSKRRDYVDQVNQMRHDDRTTLLVDFRHLLAYQQVLAEAVEEQYYRFEPFLVSLLLLNISIVFQYNISLTTNQQQRKAVQNFVRKLHPTFVADETGDKEFWLSFYNINAIQK